MPIGREISIEAPVGIVWRAIKEPDPIVEWRSDDELGVVLDALNTAFVMAWSQEKDPVAAGRAAWAKHVGDLGKRANSHPAGLRP